MGKIEEQVTKRNKEFVADLLWYIHSMNLLQAEHARAVNDLNEAFNERMKIYKETPKIKRPRKKSVNADNKSKG